MKFVIDAHLPPSLCVVLQNAGHDALHTLQLPKQNQTPDGFLNELSMVEQRVVVTKDSDFYYSHVLYGKPWKLLLVRTGNIGAGQLKSIFERRLTEIVALLETHSLVEIDWEAVRCVK